MMVDEFKAYLKTCKSRTAVDKYTQAARGFCGYLASIGKTIETAHRGALRDFVAWLVTPEAGMTTPSPATVHLQIAGVRSYLEYLRGNGVNVPDMVKPERPKIESKMPVVLSTDEVKAYARLALAEAEPYATALLILPFCGLRVDELVNLKLGDVTFKDFGPGDRRYILYVRRGKGGKSRLAPLLSGPQCAVSHALDRYLLEDRTKFQRDESSIPRAQRWLFPAPATRFYNSISVQRLQTTCVRWREETGVGDLHPHMCRATYATALLSTGHEYAPPIDALEVARYLGHAKGVDVLAEHYAGCRFENGVELFGRIARPSTDDYRPRATRQKASQTTAAREV